MIIPTAAPVITFDDIERKTLAHSDNVGQTTALADSVENDLDLSRASGVHPPTTERAAVYEHFKQTIGFLDRTEDARRGASSLAKAIAIHYGLGFVINAPDDDKNHTAREHITAALDLVNNAQNGSSYDVFAGAIALLGAVVAREPNPKGAARRAISLLAAQVELVVTVNDETNPIIAVQDHVRAIEALIDAMDAPF